jgi:hypothetical protein
MKNLSIVFVAMVAIFFVSCSSDKQNISPASQSSLGLIVPSAESAATKLILLNDGRTANPVSGIPNFSSMRAGSKLALSFIEGSTHKGILDINVTKCATAKDSVFVPKTPHSDSSSLSGLFKGTFIKRTSTDSATYFAQILFEGTNFKAELIRTDGSISTIEKGKFAVSDSTIDFLGWHFFGNEDHLLLHYSLHQNSLYLWTTKNGEFISFALTKNIPLTNLFNGSFIGTVGYRVPSTNPSDTASTVLITHPISITFKSDSTTVRSNGTYSCSGVNNSYPAAGSGKFTIKNDGVNTWIGSITFKDNVTSADSVLNGSVKYQFSDLQNQNLGLFVTRKGISYSFYLHRE